MEKKNQTNDYRAERKARIAKNADKSKKSIDSYIIVKSVLCVICAILVVFAAYGVLNAYGVPQKILPAVTVGDRTYSVAEYEYYYTSIYGSQAQQSYEMAEQYGGTALLAALGQYDYSVHPEKQTTKNDNDETITWAAYFDEYIVDMFQTYDYYFAQCKELGIELDDADYAEIDELVASVQTNADMYSVSLNRFLGSYYGNGMSERLYRKTLEDQKLAEKYLEYIESEQEAAISAEAIEAAYNADPSAYQVVDLRVFAFTTDGSSVTGNTSETTTEATATEDATEATADSSETETTEASSEAAATETEVETEASAATETTTEAPDVDPEILKKAEEFCNRITDEQSFIDLALEYAADADKEAFSNDAATLMTQISKSIIKSNISEDLAEWVFNAERAHADKYYVVSDKGDYVYVIFVVNPAYREDTAKVDVRHILVSYETGLNQINSEDHKEADSTLFATNAANAVEEFGLTMDYDLALSQNEKYTTDVVNATYTATHDIYKTYLENATEENFAKLANDYSADTASTSASENGDGGLYEDVEKGYMVANFDSWIYDESRKAGDVGIVQTEFGFHLIYFVAHNERADWEQTVIDSLTSENTEEFNKLMEDIAKDDSNVSIGTFKNYAYNESIKLIEKVYGGNYFEVE